MTDLAALSTRQKSDEGVDMVVEDPRTGDPLLINDAEVIITLAGQDSASYREAQRKIQNKRLKGVRPGQKRLDLDAAELEEESNRLLISATIGWKNVLYDGEELDCTPSNVKLIYEACPWIKDQADAFIMDRANFFGS